jgi:uncharacterized phage-associated protein
MSTIYDSRRVEGDFDSVEFASYIYREADARGLHINASKLQNWLYICYGIYFASTGRRLVTEQPQAWPQGPVFPQVQVAYKIRSRKLTAYGNPRILKTIHLNLIRSILDIFGDASPNDLTKWVIEKGRAWQDKEDESADYTSRLDDRVIIKDFTPFTQRIPLGGLYQ